MQRLQKMMPAHITPAFKTGEELLAWQKEQGEIGAAALARENRAMKMQRTFNRSGIRPLHQNCSFDNYRVECDGQMNALSKARQYVDEFDGNIASFVFSGKPGTGKNHLAAAICNELLLRGKSVLIITVADIMSAMKDTFSNRETSEEQLLNDLSNVDLLVIDEIGVQTESRYRKSDHQSNCRSSFLVKTSHRHVDEQQYGRDDENAWRTRHGPYASRQQFMG